MALKKKLKTRLDLIQEAKDNAVYVVEQDGKKVSDSRNMNLPSNRIKSYLDSGSEIAPVRTTSKKKSSSWSKSLDDGYDFGDITKTILGKGKDTITSLLDKDDDFAPIKTAGTITSNINSLSKDDLLKRRKELLEQLSNYDRKEKREWWDKDDNVLENVGNVLYKAFLEKQDSKYVEDKTYNSLREQLSEVEKLIENKTIEEESKDLNAIDKMHYTIAGNLDTSRKGIESTIQKILGQTPEADELSYSEKMAQISREQTDGIGGVGLDVLGSAARMLPQMAMPGGKAATIMGFANYGGGAYNEARREGYTDEQATKYGVTIGTLEMAMTKALGSFGEIYGNTKLGNASQSVIDKFIPKIISNKQVRHVLSQFGSEGIEEFVQEYAGKIVKDTMLDEKGLLDSTWENITDTDLLADALYSGFVGGITGATLDVPNAISRSNYEKTTGRDADTGYTQNEQTVIDSLVEEQSTEIAKQQAIENEINKAITAKETEQGGSLSAKEKTALTEAIKAKIEAGEVDVSSTKLTNKEISKIRKEVEENLQKGLLDTTKIDSILGDTITEQDALLGRSYEEQTKKGQAFAYDNTKVTDAQEKAVYESAAKYFNDTTRSHEFVEKVAKIAKDKGTNYGFINNEELKSLGHDVEGKQVNGLVRVSQDGKQTVLINIDSNKALNTIVGHETTHLLEGTQEYTELQEAIFNYAKGKNDFDSRQKALNSLYEGIENANIDSELTADLIGDYLFTDSDFIDSLSVQKPTVFQKIRELIDDLVVRFTGTKEEKALREVQKKFKEAYRKNATRTDADTKYSVSDNQGRTLTKEQQEYFKDSKVRDKEGQLLEVYHGTPNDFNVYDTKFIGKNGLNYGIGYYLTNDIEEASKFAKDGKLKKQYVDIKKPINLKRKTINIEQIENIITELNNKYPYYKTEELKGVAKQIDSLENNDYILSSIKDRFTYPSYELDDLSTRYANIMNSITNNTKYDGIIVKSPYEKGKNIYIAFNSNQIKNIDNTNPTSDADIRYSLSETGTHGTLMAIHNLSAEKLKGIIELGGFPVPSIAITNPEIVPFEMYGNISVLFDKNTIDPSNTANEVYGSDVYSPRFPQTVNELNDTGVKQVANILEMSPYEFEVNYENMSIDDVVNRIYRDEKVIDKYLESKNITVEPIYKEYKTEQSGVSTKFVEDFLNAHEELKNNDINLRELNYEKYSNEVKQIYINSLVEQGVPIKDAQELYSNFEKADITKFLIDVKNFKKASGQGQQIDTYATKQAKAQHIDFFSDEYMNFVENLISPAFGDKYIRNNKDLYTPSGNRRSFKQLHEPYNLENVVKNMKGKVRGEEGFFYGAGNIRSQVTPQFKSIADIKANEGKLVTTEQMEEVKQDINSDLNNLSVTAKNFGGYSYDSYEAALNEIAGLKKITSNKARSIFSDYGFNNVPDILIDKSIEFLEKLKNAPTEYFEAKPQRAVGLNEVQAIVIPNNISAELKQQLLDEGLNIVEYDPNIEGDKQSKINQFDDLKFSLSQQGEQIAPTGNYNVYGEDVKLEQTIAPLQEEIKTLTETVQELKEQIAPVKEEVAEVEYTQPSKAELDNLMALQETGGTEYANTFFELRDKYGQRKLYKGINEYKKAPDTYEAPIKGDEFAPITEADLPMLQQQYEEDFKHIDESSMPGEIDEIAPDVEDEVTPTKSLFETRDYTEVGNRKVNAYQYDNPEVKPFFQEEAQAMLGDLKASIKGERNFNDQLYYDSGGEQGFYGTERQTTSDIAELLDGMDGKYKYTYADIEKGLNAIIKDEGSENNAISKRIEFYLDQRLREGYTSVDGIEVPANRQYIELLESKEIADYYSSIPVTDDMAPVENVENYVENVSNSKEIAPTKKLDKLTTRTTEASSPEPINKAYQLTIDGKAEKVVDNSTYNEIAEILTEEPKTESDRNKRKWAIFKANVLDKGIVFEDLSLKENNRELIAKWDYTLTSEARGQYAIGNGHNGLSKSLNDIRAEVENTGNTKDFYNYVYHKHNVDRMSLDKRFGIENKPVFGESVTAEQSQAIVNQYEKTHPEFIEFAQDVYDYVNADKQLLIDNGVISQDTADLWSKMYPHYVPTRRTTDTGIDINVPLDTRKTGINAPIKKATGGSSDILPLFDTMAMRTLQTYRATAKNSFGVELRNTMGTTTESSQTNVDEVIDTLDAQEGLLQEGKKGKNPTFTVFENGEKFTFEITKDMYDALKPVSESSLLSKTIKPLNIAGNIRRGVLTEYNPTFMLTNAIKDTQDILLNSQHSLKTYAKIPEAHKQLLTKGYWYKEYIANGGEQNSYFDNETNTFKTENKGLAKITDLPPLSTISKINNHIEMIPRLAEYIASREAGRSIEVSMLDAARVTTNFKAGGAVTKWANRNGATFLNASVQGAMQQVRNVREAKANGVRGWVNLATKFTMAALPAVLLNNLVWDDDEEYEELSDYVKQNYYVIGKTDDGTFIRIPKGRAVAVIQDAVNQMQNLITGDDEADLKSFIDLTLNNLAPNNPLDNNILSPIIQVSQNKAWYGGDLLPTRLQNLPDAEQYDESTDMLSRWLGEIFDYSPYKINYLIDQYSGGVGDLLLPMMTPEAESDGDTLTDYLLAPIKSKFTTNSTYNNQNVNDFYDTKEKLTIQANKTNATDEDKLMIKYMNSVNAELSELYEQKREIQNSDLSNSEKYRQATEIQEQITEITKNALSEYTNVRTASDYSTVGDKEYYKRINSEGEVEWTKVNEEEAEDLSSLGLTKSEKNTYFKTKSEISSIVSNYKDNKSDLEGLGEDSDEYKEAIEELSDDKKADIIDKIKETGLNDEQKAYLYGKYYSSDKTLEKVTNSGISFDDFLTYHKDCLSFEETEEKAEYLYNAAMSDEAKTVIYETSVLTNFDNEEKNKGYKAAKAAGININAWLSYKKQEFEADRDKDGDPISGSKKRKVINYINGLDLSIPEKAILIKSTNTFKFNDYNNQIVKYVDGLDISQEEKIFILEELDMKVDSNGKVTWK